MHTLFAAGKTRTRPATRLIAETRASGRDDESADGRQPCDTQGSAYSARCVALGKGDALVLIGGVALQVW